MPRRRLEQFMERDRSSTVGHILLLLLLKGTRETDYTRITLYHCLLLLRTNCCTPTGQRPRDLRTLTVGNNFRFDNSFIRAVIQRVQR